MADLNHTKTKKRWQQYDPDDLLELELDMDDDDELLFDDDDSDVEVDVEDDDLDPERPLQLDTVPSWRRIEIAREDRFLKMAMADFEDYDDIDDFGGDFSAGYSH